MSSKSKSKRNSPKTSEKTKDTVRERKNASKIEEGSSNLFDFGVAMESAVKGEDIKRIVSIQNKSLKSFIRTNELLGKFNDFSSSKYEVLQHMFVQHTRLLVELKKDLTNVFMRIRCLKLKLQKQHPEAFEATFNLRKDLEDRLESELPNKPTYNDKTKVHNMDERNNEIKSVLNEEQVLSLKLAGKKESEKGSTAKDTTEDDIPSITQNEQRNTEDDEIHCQNTGTSRSDECITENFEETKETDQVLPSQQFSLKSVGDNQVQLKGQEHDAKVAMVGENLRVITEVGVIEENQLEEIGNVEVDCVKDEDEEEGSIEDNLEHTKDGLEDMKDEDKHEGSIEDNLEHTNDGLEEMKDEDKHEGSIEDNL